MVYQVNLTGVGDNELGSLVAGLQNGHADYRMGGSGVAADREDTGGITDVVDRVGHGSAAEGGGQTGHRRGMSEAGTVVYVVRAQYRTGEFLHDVVVFVGALG